MSGRFFLSGTIPLFEGAAQPLSTLTVSLTGTSTPTDTYSDNNRSVANTNPVVADANGYFGEIFLSRFRCKIIWKNAAGTTLKTFDPVDAEGILVRATSAPSDPWAGMIYDNTTDGHRYQRNLANSAWVDLGLTDAVSGASVTQQLAGTATNVLSTPDSVAALWQRGTDIASDTSLSLPSTGGAVFNVTGTNAIEGIGAAYGGRIVILKFADACALTHDGTSFILRSGANETTYAGLVMAFCNEAAADGSGSNWRCIYHSGVATQAQMEAGSVNNAAVTPGRQHYHPGHPKFWAFATVSGNVPTLQTSYNVTSITDSGTGLLTVTIANDFSSTNWAPFVTTQRDSTTMTSTAIMASGVRNASIAAGAVVAEAHDFQATPALEDPLSWSVMGMGDI